MIIQWGSATWPGSCEPSWLIFTALKYIHISSDGMSCLEQELFFSACENILLVTGYESFWGLPRADYWMRILCNNVLILYYVGLKSNRLRQKDLILLGLELMISRLWQNILCHWNSLDQPAIGVFFIAMSFTGTVWTLNCESAAAYTLYILQAELIMCTMIPISTSLHVMIYTNEWRALYATLFEVFKKYFISMGATGGIDGAIWWSSIISEARP